VEYYLQWLIHDKIAEIGSYGVASTVIFGAVKVSRHHKSLSSILLVRSTPQPWDTCIKCIKCLQWSTYIIV